MTIEVPTNYLGFPVARHHNQVLALVGVNNTKTVIIPNGYNTYLEQNQVVLGKNDFLVLTFVPDLQKWLQVGFEQSSS